MWQEAFGESELKDNEIKGISINGRPLLFIKKNGNIHSLDLYCTHEQTSLAEGFIEKCNIVCSNHFASFDIKTGNVTAGPDGDDTHMKNLNAYKTKVENGKILVDIP